MKDNYPLMSASQLRDAPWNQEEPEPIDVDCCVSYCMSKTMPVAVSNYIISKEYDCDIDDEGKSYCHTWQETDFENTNFIEEFENDSNSLGLPSLLEELGKLCKEKIDKLKDELALCNQYTAHRIYRQIKNELSHYQNVLELSKGWVVDDMDVTKE
jgi:hypothetical protein